MVRFCLVLSCTWSNTPHAQLFFILSFYKDDHQSTKESADWVSISLEMERWNLLVNQLEDILNLAVFCLTLVTADHTQRSEQPRELSKAQELLSNVTVLSK